MKQVKIEFIKLKNSKILIPAFLLPFISVIFGSFSYYGNIQLLKNEWISLWSQVYLFYGFFFFPCLSAIYSAYVYNIEHRHNNLKLLLSSPISYNTIILSKTTVVFLLNILTQLYLISLFVLFGMLFNFKMAFPYEILYLILLSTIFSIANISVQNYLSLKIKSFAIPVAIAMIISVIALVGSAFTKVELLKYIFATTSITHAMNLIPEKIYFVNDFLLMGLCSLVIFTIFFYLQKKELKNKFN
ncbi:ABC transporter permease [Peptostreptococcus faecalis]|uniref:ABC transporter permease n=1 Tax=Peptostreptococcus faecalis TaxID=2045015 RepID=UPI000C7A4A79|nr:ABC transporter permease [Peptostreptococcus faecalis]